MSTGPPVPDDGRRGVAWSRLASWDTVVIVVLTATVLIAAGAVDGFGTARNFNFLILDVAAIALIALPMTLVIITGEIDLSVASALGLTSSVMGQLWLVGLPLETIIVLCLVLGAVLGAVNGVFVTRFGLPSLAVTIGTLAMYRGLAYVVLGDRAVADFPRAWTRAVTSSLPGVPVPAMVLPLVALAVVFGLLLHATPVGRSLYAIGANDEAARFSGVAVARTKFWLFVATGTMSALAGIYWTFRYASARADNAAGLELSVVAAVLLGGVSIFGGRGTLPGVMAGVLLLGTLINALRLANVSAEALSIVTGLLLIVSVLTPNVIALGRRALARRAGARSTDSAVNAGSPAR
jgi:rhamnose transport system permease protein